MADEPAKPDAIRVPRDPGGGFDRLGELDSVYREILGTPAIYVRDQGSVHFITGNPEDLLYFPKTSPAAGLPRYRWEDQGEGIAFGFLIPEEEAAPKRPDNILTRLRAIVAARALTPPPATPEG